MSETVLILAVGTAVIAVLFGARVFMRTAAPDGTSATDVPGVIALPPLIFLGFLVVATVLELIAPLPPFHAYAMARYLTGAVLVLAGFVVIGLGTQRFVAAGTNIPPNLPTTALVVDGIYAKTRNPMYLGSTLVYVGLGVAAGSVWAIGLAVPLLWVMNVGVIAREERYLERKFGEAYRAYKARVRRWL
jgi:protein-S-isoprenylcysteine O-methyltransferase Ste14